MSVTAESLRGLRRKEDVARILSDVGRHVSGALTRAGTERAVLELKKSVQNGSIQLQIEELLPEAERNARDVSNFLTAMRRASLKTWIMKPLVKTAGMTDGSLNEIEVLRVLPRFFKTDRRICRRESRPTHIETLDAAAPFHTKMEGVPLHFLQLECVGLVCDSFNEQFADSPDAISVLKLDGCLQKAAVEVKTVTEPSTITPAKRIRSDLGDVTVLDNICSSDQKALDHFKRAVFNVGHRVQLLHHAAVLGVLTVCYVVATGGRSVPGSIQYVLVATFSKELLKDYTFLLASIQYSSFPWIGLIAEYIPEEYDDLVQEKHVNDLFSISSFYNLSMALSQCVSEHGRPLPPCRMLRSTSLVSWNVLKGGVDEFSRYMDAFAPVNRGESPFTSVLGRILSAQVNNSFLVHRIGLASAQGVLPSKEAISTALYTYLRHTMTNLSTAKDFGLLLAKEWCSENYNTLPIQTAQGPPSHVAINPWFEHNIISHFNCGRVRSTRLNDSLSHKVVRSASSKYCSLCYWELKYRGVRRRIGKKRNTWCHTCRQVICPDCYEAWHSKERLVKLRPDSESVSAVKASIGFSIRTSVCLF